MLLGCGQDELGIGRRLFECFQESIECRRRQHMHLVDDIHLVFSNLGRDPHLVDQVADIIHRIVGCGIELMDIKRCGAVERQARFALIAGLHLVDRVEAVDRLGQDTGAGGLANPPRAAKKERLGQLVVPDRVLQCRGDRVLPDYRVERRWPVFPG